MSKVCAKAQRDLDDLKQQLAARGHEMARVKSFAQEREGAADALAEELQQLRKESADREVKLREALQAESRRVEKQLAREKALIVVKTQEVAAANHQRELMEVRDRMMEEKQAALAEQKQQHAAQVEELTRKLHAREEEKRSLVLQLEDSRQSAAVAREEASRQLKQQLHEMRGVGPMSLLVCHHTCVTCHCLCVITHVSHVIACVSSHMCHMSLLHTCDTWRVFAVWLYSHVVYHLNLLYPRPWIRNANRTGLCWQRSRQLWLEPVTLPASVWRKSCLHCRVGWSGNTAARWNVCRRS